MILCITPNIALERTWDVLNLRLGGVLRAQDELLLAGGKGLNVARVVHTLGGESLAVGFLAGHTGRQVQALAEAEGLAGEFIWVDGETRAAVTLVDRQTSAGNATVINGQGARIGADDWERLAGTVLTRLPCAAACFCGSLPPGVTANQVTDLVRQIQALGCPVWVDSSAAGLQAGFQARAHGIKANGDEIGELLGMVITDVDSAQDAARRIRAAGVANAVITLGERGAVMAGGGSTWLAIPPKLAAVSAVGSGDAFLGGLLLGITEGEDTPTALRWAAAAGAANTQSLGGGRLQRTQFEQYLGQTRAKRLE